MEEEPLFLLPKLDKYKIMIWYKDLKGEKAIVDDLAKCLRPDLVQIYDTYKNLDDLIWKVEWSEKLA